MTTDICGKCGGEGKCVEIPGTRADGFSQNVWCPGGVLLIWDEVPA